VDGTVRLLDVASGRLLRATGPGSLGAIRRAMFTPDGSRVVIAGQDGSLRAWTVASGELRGVGSPIGGLKDVGLDGSGHYLLTLEASPGVHVRSLETGGEEATLTGAKGSATVLAAAGSLVVTGGPDGWLTVWDVARRAAVWQAPSAAGITAVAIDPAGRFVASAHADGLVQLWRATDGRHDRTLRPDNGTARSLAFDAGGTRLAVAGWYRTTVWDLGRPTDPPRTLGSPYGTTDVHFRPDGRVLATCIDGTGHVRLWDLVADTRLDHWTGDGTSIAALAVGEARSLVTADGRTLRAWQRGQPAAAFVVDAGAAVSSLATSPDGRWIVTAGEPANSAVWDARDGHRVVRLPDARIARAVAFSADGRRIFAGEIDGTLATWDWAAGVASGSRRTPPADREILALATGRGRVIVAHRNLTVTVLDDQTQREIWRFHPLSAAFSLAVSPDGRLLAAGTWIGSIVIWDLDTGQQVNELKGQARGVVGLDFSPDGRLLVSASLGGPMWVWDVAAGLWIATVPARPVGAERIRFVDDGRHLAIGYQDGEVEVRDLTYFFRHAAGQAPYQLAQLRATGAAVPRADDVLAWSRRVLAGR